MRAEALNGRIGRGAFSTTSLGSIYRMLKPMKLLFLMICLLPSLVFGDSRPDVIPISNVAAKNAYDKTYAKGLELFNKRCKTAGRKIKSIVFGEIGIRIDTPRAERSYDRFSDKLWSDAGLPVERVGDKFIASFLDFYFNDSTLPSFAPGLDGTVLMQGFQFVDVKQADGTFLRYKLAGDDPSKGMTQMSIPSSQASRYAVIISPLGTNEERENWVAGAHIMAMDTKTKHRPCNL